MLCGQLHNKSINLIEPNKWGDSNSHWNLGIREKKK